MRSDMGDLRQAVEHQGLMNGQDAYQSMSLITRPPNWIRQFGRRSSRRIICGVRYVGAIAVSPSATSAVVDLVNRLTRRERIRSRLAE